MILDRLAVNNIAEVLLHTGNFSDSNIRREVLYQYLAVPYTEGENYEEEKPKSDIEALGAQWVAMFGNINKNVELDNDK